MEKFPPRDTEESRRSLLEQQTAELAQLKDALRQAEDKYRVLVENANDAIFVLQDGKIKFANPKALAMGGVLAKDLEKVPFSEYLHPEERDMVLQRYEKRLKGEKILNMYPLRIVTRSGDLFWAEVNAVRIEWEGRPATLNIIRDITSQKLIEQHYFQNENLATLRTLAGGTAHSFNNLLMGIQGRVSILSRNLAADDPRREHLRGIEQCVADAAKLTQQMLGFAQSGKYSVVRVNLNLLIEQILESMLHKEKHISIRRDLQLGLWPVEVDRHQLEEAIMNILVNAWQAIADSGEIIIKTENFEMTEGRERFQDMRTGKYVRLAVRDTGVGMEDTVRKRVFEPFFTTKGLGKHRGLGLSSAYGIVANHAGLIDVESTPGAGTTVSVYLPSV
ncbi:MAG: PAS domain S-box protein [Desulfobacteraceae bacterium]|nr:PAS domain S-box protein [Desulfobacteraceae bacterium]